MVSQPPESAAKQHTFDLIIVGGGMVGATLACALSGSSLKIGLIERQSPSAFTPEQPHDLRVSALSIASQTILENVGAWEGILSRRACPYRRMRVWETAGAGDTMFDSQDINYPYLGHIVENRIVQLSLWDQLRNQSNVTLFTDTEIAEIRCLGFDNSVRLSSDELLSARLLVAADGGASQVRTAAGLGVMSEEYPQQALVLYVKTACSQQDITWQRFYPSGPRALLPLTGPYASLVWYDSPERIKQLAQLSDEMLLNEVYGAFPGELGQVDTLLARASFPLKRQHALSYGKEGVVLIGDAAHMIHPLAGQGVNIGLLDAAALAEVLLNAGAENADIGAAELMAEYEKDRRQHNALMMTTMDLFYRVFKDNHAPVGLLRNLGLKMAQTLTPARNKAMKFAMGLEGKLPPLAKKAG